MSETVIASNGQLLDLAAAAHVYGYSGSNLITDTVVISGVTYIKTYTYTGSNLTAESRWIAQ